MKILDVQARLACASAGVAVLRVLRVTDKTMRYKDFAKAIGLMSEGEDWKPWHRKQVSDTLYLISATEKQAGHKTGVAAVQFDRLVNEKGVPGAGFGRKAKIVKPKA